MKVLVTGSNGLVGSHLVKRLSQNPKHSVVATSLHPNKIPLPLSFQFVQAHLTQAEQVAELIQQTQPDAIFHCAAISQVDVCEENPELCHQVNVVGTQHLIQCAEQHTSACKFVFYSTDFVFSGTKNSEYMELDPTDPVSEYGRSKVRAEKLLMQSNLNWNIIRPILIYGTSPSVSRGNIVKWVKSSLEKQQAIRVVNDQFRQPISVHSLIDLSEKLLTYSSTGIFHAAGKNQLSVYDFACEIARFYELKTSLIHPVSSQKLNEKGKRPEKTWFNLTKAKEEVNFSPTDVVEGLKMFEIF